MNRVRLEEKKVKGRRTKKTWLKSKTSNTVRTSKPANSFSTSAKSGEI